MKWGFIGCGDIARKTAKVLAELPQEQLRAVASRSMAKAQAFAAETGAETAYGSYEALIADPAVEIVYVATPHPQHCEWTLAALAAGKHVLCEKPMALNARETRQMIDAARRHRRFLMEAVWTRFLPAMVDIRARVAAGSIGELRMLQADTSYRTPIWPDHRLYRLDLAGGGLMDIGVYAISMATWFLGQPTSIQSVAHLGETGVDEQAAILLGYPGGALAQVTSGIRTSTINELTLLGTRGKIRVHPGFIRATAFDLMLDGEATTTHRFDDRPSDRRYMLAATSAAIAQGWLEHPEMPLAESQMTADIMTACRKSWGLRYPGDA